MSVPRTLAASLLCLFFDAAAVPLIRLALKLWQQQGSSGAK